MTIDRTTEAAGVYPIVLVTYEIVCSKGDNEEKTALLKAFLKHVASAETQTELEGIGYAPIPAEIALALRSDDSARSRPAKPWSRPAPPSSRAK